MNYLFEKVSYLQGLAEGLDITEESNEGKLLLHIIDTLGEFADVLDEIAENQVDLEEYVNFIDEDLADVEDELYDDEYFDEDDFDFEEYEDCCDDENCECYCEGDEE
jgi:hypothetical protein